MTDSTAGREEPRWPAIIALLSVSGLYWAMPEPLTPGPGWLVPAMAAPLSIAALLFHKRSRDHAAQVVGYVLSGIVTVALIGALALLIAALPNKNRSAPRSAQVRRRTVGLQYPGLCRLVLEARRRRPAPPRINGRLPRRRAGVAVPQVL